MKYLVAPGSSCCSRIEKEMAEAEHSKGVWHKSDGNKTQACPQGWDWGEKQRAIQSSSVFLFWSKYVKEWTTKLNKSLSPWLSYNTLLSPLSFTSPQHCKCPTNSGLDPLRRLDKISQSTATFFHFSCCKLTNDKTYLHIWNHIIQKMLHKLTRLSFHL